MRSTVLLAALGIAASACQSKSSDTANQKTAETPVKLAGVRAENFKCDSIAKDDELGTVLGGKVRAVDSAMTTPRGVAKPCTYEVITDAGNEVWTFDFDCRDGMRQRADALFAQYRTDSAAMIDSYNALADAGGIKPNDAGVSTHAPEPAVDVNVGARGLDHHGQGLLFVDDDAPCYVRVVGPDAQRRLALAQLIAKNLTFANAPMMPRPMP